MLLAPWVPVVNMHIRAAYGGFVYFDKHLAYSRLWNGYLGKNKSFCTLRFNKRIHHFLHTINLAELRSVTARPRCTDILYFLFQRKSIPWACFFKACIMYSLIYFNLSMQLCNFCPCATYTCTSNYFEYKYVSSPDLLTREYSPLRLTTA